MTQLVPSVVPAYVTRAVCLKEVPKSEAIVPEVADCVAYFCSVEG